MASSRDGAAEEEERPAREDQDEEADIDASEGVYRGGNNSSIRIADFIDAGSLDSRLPNAFNTGLVDLSAQTQANDDARSLVSEGKLRDVRLIAPARVDNGLTCSNASDTITISSQNCQGLSDSKVEQAVAMNESGSCVTTNKGYGNGKQEKTYTINGSISVVTDSSERQYYGGRVETDAR